MLTAFRDRNVGSDRNYGRSTEERTFDGPRGGAGARVRGGKSFTFSPACGSLYIVSNQLLGRGARARREFDDRNPVRRDGHG